MFGRDKNRERTPEDRARAAAERAARRAARGGRQVQLPTEAFLHSTPPPPTEPSTPPAEERPPPSPPQPEELEPDPPLAAERPRDVEPPLAGEGTPEADPPGGERFVRPEPPVAEEGPREADPPGGERFASREPPAGARPAPPGPRPVEPSTNHHRPGPPPVDPAESPATTEWSPEAAWAEEDAETWDGDWDRVDWTAPEEAAPEPEATPPTTNVRPLTAVQTLPRPVRAAAPPPAPKATGRRPRPRMRSRPGTGPTRRWGRRFGALLALLAIGGALYVINATFQPFHGDAGGPVGVRIPEGSDAGEIGERLADAGVIDSATFFNLNATLTGRRGDLQPGDYTLARDMSNGEALDALVNGPGGSASEPSFRLTIPEGRSRREIVPLVRKTSLQGSYLKATAKSDVRRRARRLGAPKRLRSLEGFLFPATYDLRAGQSVDGLVDQQLDAFAENLDRVDMRYAKRRRLTRYDVLIIASMIEREAALARERRLIAAVIYNRLRRGMPLGIDATIRYATNNWTSPIKASDLARDSAYNTRMRRGLPPTPIGNPGLSALKAAARPANVSYLYYVVKPCGEGAHAFSSSEERFNRDFERYRREREKRGKSPANC